MKTIGSRIPRLGGASETNQRTWFAGLAVAVMLVGLTVLGRAYGPIHGPHINGFIPITATVWIIAELLTAFLLLSQFQFSAKIALAIVAAGYGFSGLLTIPYLLWFPGMISDAPLSRGELQICPWLWLAWHLVFPTSIAVAHLLDRSLDTLTVPKKYLRRAMRLTLAGTALTGAAAYVAIYSLRDTLPALLYARGGFTPFFETVMIPVLVAVNALALATLLVRARRPSALQTWLAVALLTMFLDGLLNFWSSGRFSVAWYVGKIEALITGTVVCFMLLREIVGLYRRLYHFASMDELTGLRNRRSFSERAEGVIVARDARTPGIALLIVDIDFFKEYNDRYGHTAGDAALAAVASSLRASVVRAKDSVARYGGDEFVILLPDVLLAESEGIGERVRRRVAELAIVHEGAPTGRLTVTFGIGYCARENDVSEATLFNAADEALYRAKREGRDRGASIVVAPRHAAEGPRSKGGPRRREPVTAL